MARKTKFDNIDSIMSSAIMHENSSETFSQAKKDEELIDVSINNIIDNPFQPRLEMDASKLKELVESIDKNGLLQPVVVIKNKDQYVLIAGHRRVEAFKLLKRKSITAILKNTINPDTEEYNSKMSINSLIENIQRENLNPMEIALSFQNLLNNKIVKTKSELASLVGKSNAYVSKVLSLLKLNSEVIIDLNASKSITDLETLYELQRITDNDVQKEFYQDLKNKKIKRNDLRNYNKKIKNNIIIDDKPKISLEIRNNDLIIKTNLKNISKERHQELKSDIELLLVKYTDVTK
jgi:ParB family chromosome partitioning protein